MNKRLHTANHQKVASLVRHRLRNQCSEKAEGGRLQVEPILGYRVRSHLKTKQKQRTKNKIKKPSSRAWWIQKYKYCRFFSHIGTLDFNFYVCVSLYVCDVVNRCVIVCACEYIFMGMSVYL